MRYVLFLCFAFATFAYAQEDLLETVWSDWNATADNSTVVVDLGGNSTGALDDEFDSLGRQLIDLISGMMMGGGRNETTWTFVSFVTLVPLPCSSVHAVASLFDRAMATTNPGAGIVSTPRRLGGLACSSDGVCPCSDAGNRRKYVTRVMELSSHSLVKSVAYPLETEFPYHVAIQPLPVF